MSRLSLLSSLNAFCALIGIKFLAVSTETSSVNDTHLLIYFTFTILNCYCALYCVLYCVGVIVIVLKK